MKNVAPVRQSLRIKTFFNMLGPMVNPAFPKNQLVGVFSLDVARLYNYLYQESDKNYCIIHSLDGYDEISLTGEFKALTRQTERSYTPIELGLNQVSEADIYGGSTVEEASAVFLQILEGEGTEAQNDVVVANAALALFCMDESRGLENCIGRARESLDSGAALSTFKNLIESN